MGDMGPNPTRGGTDGRERGHIAVRGRLVPVRGGKVRTGIHGGAECCRGGGGQLWGRV